MIQNNPSLSPADDELRRQTFNRLYGDERRVFESIVGNLEITGEELVEYLSMPKKRVWAALDSLLEAGLVTRSYSDDERVYIYTMADWE